MMSAVKNFLVTRKQDCNVLASILFAVLKDEEARIVRLAASRHSVPVQQD
jgi:hypothetical protein